MPATLYTDRSLPTGTVTFLFTDIEGSTKLWEAHPEVMGVALARHDALLREGIIGASGYVFKTVGDAFCAAFALAPAAVAAALRVQTALAAESWPGTTPIKVRMALHTGAVESRDGDYFGPALNKVARLLPAGHGGQTLLSQTTYELSRDSLPDDVALRDLGAHRLKDLARPEHVYELQHPALPGDFPPINSLSTHPNNLPQQLTSFVGREKEIAELKALLGKARLLTLTGSGGSGKTRLCLQVGADSLDQFPDGGWFVELAALLDPGLVPQAVATVLGLKEEPRKPITQTLTEYLKIKRILLLLDNCEHLLGGCTKVADALMRQCPGVKILATSREALGIAGEQTFRVPLLSLPDRTEVQTPRTLSTYESVKLFIDRALLVRTDFQVTNQNAPALASLCCHLDGIPLAIELAAARVRTLSVEEIDGKLDQRFRLLTGGSRTALPRHQTLRSLIDWSYDLLDDQEQRLLQRLSVFAGGWTLAAAEKVCIGECVDGPAILDLLTSLSDKSLVLAEQAEGRSRYRLLETVRQYAHDRLEESEGRDAVRERHRDYFLAIAVKAEVTPWNPKVAEGLQCLEEEIENLRVGLDWSVTAAESGAGLRLCGTMFWFWVLRGHLSEGQEWCMRVLGNAGGEGPRRAYVLNVAGKLAHCQGDYSAARARYEESQAIWWELGDKRGIAVSLHNLGDVNIDKGDLLAARASFEESLAINREIGHRRGISTAQLSLGDVALEEGDHSTARALYEESLAIRRELGFQAGIAESLQSLGYLDYQQGDYSAARASYEQSLAITCELGFRPMIAALLEGLAAVVAAFGNSIRAARIWGAAESLREELDRPRSPIEWPRHDRWVATARAAVSDDAAFDHAWQEGRALPLDLAIKVALEKTFERG